MLEALDNVDWTSLEHAHGGAEDVQDLIVLEFWPEGPRFPLKPVNTEISTFRVSQIHWVS